MCPLPSTMRPMNLPGYGKVEGMPTLSEDLAFRGLIHQVTDPELPKRLDEPGLTVYAGFDPSADSLHVGSLLQLCTLRRFQEAGHRPISLAGGGTGMIGDPGGKEDERQLLTLETIERYLEGIRPQLGQFLDLDRGPPPQQRRLARLDLDARVPPRRRQALHRQPDGGQGVGPGPLRAARPGHLLHRVQLHAAAGLRLPAPARRPRLQPAVRRQRPVGQHHHGHRAHPQGVRRRGLGLHHAAHREAGRHQVRQDRDGHRLARCAAEPARSPCTSSSSTPPTSRWASCSATSPSSTTTRSAISTPRPPSTRSAAAQKALARAVVSLVHGEAEVAKCEEASAALFSEEIAGLSEDMLLAVTADAPTTSVPRAELLDGGLTLVDALERTGLAKSKARGPPHDRPGRRLRQQRAPDRRHPDAGDGRPPARPLRRPAQGSPRRPHPPDHMRRGDPATGSALPLRWSRWCSCSPPP